jgi:hypothetical protein
MNWSCDLSSSKVMVLARVIALAAVPRSIASLDHFFLGIGPLDPSPSMPSSYPRRWIGNASSHPTARLGQRRGRRDARRRNRAVYEGGRLA